MVDIGRFNPVVIGCMGIVIGLYSIAVFNVILPYYSAYTANGIFNLFALTATTSLGLYTYLQCVITDPGQVPLDWQPPPSSTLQQIKRNGKSRYCTKCNCHKPPRAHHCRRCGRCVLRMDHHCVWVNNCIGHGNYKAFLLMILYLTIAALHTFVLLCIVDAKLVQAMLGLDYYSKSLQALGDDVASSDSGSLLNTATNSTTDIEDYFALATERVVGWPEEESFWFRATVQILATSFTLPIVVGLLFLLLWNGYLFLNNKTTIEHHEGVRSVVPGGHIVQQQQQQHVSHLYNVGVYANVVSVCGDEPSVWLIPCSGIGGASAQGDGLSFPTIWRGSDVGGGTNGIDGLNGRGRLLLPR